MRYVTIHGNKIDIVIAADRSSTAKNIASFPLVWRLGLLDVCTFTSQISMSLYHYIVKPCNICGII